MPLSPGASCRRRLVRRVAAAAWPSCAAPLPLRVRSPSDGISSTPVEAGRHSRAGVTEKAGVDRATAHARLNRMHQGPLFAECPHTRQRACLPSAKKDNTW